MISKILNYSVTYVAQYLSGFWQGSREGCKHPGQNEREVDLPQGFERIEEGVSGTSTRNFEKLDLQEHFLL